MSRAFVYLAIAYALLFSACGDQPSDGDADSDVDGDGDGDGDGDSDVDGDVDENLDSDIAPDGETDTDPDADPHDDADTVCTCSGDPCEPPGSTGLRCDGCNYVEAPEEICWDHIDNNCDGAPDNGCANGTPVYIDPTYTGANGTEDGSFLRPFDAWTDFTITAGNDYRQRCGTETSTTVAVDAAGTASNRIVIGAYYDDGAEPVHEDDNPHFGPNCGDGTTKPNMRRGVRTTSEDHVLEGSEQYVVFDSLRFDTPIPAVPVRVASQHNTLQFLYIKDSEWGIRLNRYQNELSHFFYIGYSYFDLGTVNDENHETVDPINYYDGADNGIIEYNVITGYDHIAIYSRGGDQNTIQYNRCEKGPAAAEDYCVSLQSNSNSNIVRYNYSQDAGHGVSISEGCSNNVVFANVMTCDNATVPGGNGACLSLYNQFNDVTWDLSDNFVFNNTIYESDVGDTVKGIGFYCSPDVTSTMHGNRFHNNLIEKVDRGMVFGDDCNGRDNSDQFFNNLIHGWDTENGYYVNFFPIGGIHHDADSLNGMDFASGNRDDDPSLSDPSGDEFWPLPGSPAIGNGFDTGEDYDDLIDPVISNLSASPMQVFTVDWDTLEGPYIGAFSRE